MEFSNFSIFAGGGRSDGTGEPPTGYSFLGHFGHHYNPDQPRVPAGHRDGGQWTRGWGGSPDTVPGRPKGPKLGIQVAANDNVVSDAPSEWRPWAQYAANDNRRGDLDDPNDRHRQGVDAAIKDYIARGYSLIHASPVAVDVPGFPTPRF